MPPRGGRYRGPGVSGGAACLAAPEGGIGRMSQLFVERQALSVEPLCCLQIPSCLVDLRRNQEGRSHAQTVAERLAELHTLRTRVGCFLVPTLVKQSIGQIMEAGGDPPLVP